MTPALATDTPFMFISSRGRRSTIWVSWMSDTMTSPETCLSPCQLSANLSRAASASSTAMPTLWREPFIPGFPTISLRRAFVWTPAPMSIIGAKCSVSNPRFISFDKSRFIVTKSNSVLKNCDTQYQSLPATVTCLMSAKKGTS